VDSDLVNAHAVVKPLVGLPSHEQFGQLGWVAGRLMQGQQQPGSSRAGQGVAEAGKHLAMSQRLHPATV
jgi:hypothetical protein